MRPVAGFALLALSGALAWGQTAISARSGMVHYVEGRVLINDQAVESKFGQFPEVKENQTLRTEEGRAEVLLTPGAFLRVAENSSVRMITNRLIDTRLELVSGSAVVEIEELPKDNAITLVVNNVAAHLPEKGLYRFDASPAQLRVYDGKANVETGDHTTEVKEGRMIALDGDLTVAKFDKEAGDALNRWSQRRAEYISLANMSAAKAIHDSGYSLLSSTWRWNPYYGMFTFIPYRGMLYSPYGFRYYSPITVGRVYYNPPPMVFGRGGYGGYNADYGYRTMAPTYSGRSGTIAAAPSMGVPASHAPSTAASSAGSAPVSRAGGGGSGGHR